jgi:hypothetical protein
VIAPEGAPIDSLECLLLLVDYDAWGKIGGCTAKNRGGVVWGTAVPGQAGHRRLTLMGPLVVKRRTTPMSGCLTFFPLL